MVKASPNAQAPGLFASLESAGSNSLDVPMGLTELFRFRFGTGSGHEAINCFPLSLRPIGNDVNDEVWYTNGPISNYEDQGVIIAESPDYIALHVEHAISDETLIDVTERTYRQLYDIAHIRGFKHLQRAWNYFPQINHGTGDTERYRQFSIGRAVAFEKFGLTKQQLPAGTAIGTGKDSPLTVTLLVAKQPCLMLENPRQISAYEYPHQYGQRSPSFARAALVPLSHRHQLLISGTASVVGHASRHDGDIVGQCREALRNIDTLISHANTRTGKSSEQHGDLSHSCFRVYVRQPSNLGIVKKELTETLGPLEHIVFLQGDICRRELMVEIEGNHWI